MADKKWQMTEQMVEALKNDPGNEQEYTHYLGGILRSTHWLLYDKEKDLIGDSTDWYHYGWYTEEEFMDDFAGHWWRRNV